MFLQEAKKLGHRTKYEYPQIARSDFQHATLGKFHTAKISARNSYNLSKLASIVSDTKADLASYLSGYQSGVVPLGSFENKVKKALKQAHEDAYLLGMKSTGFEGDVLPQVDKKWVDSNRYDEHGYLSQFLKDVEEGTGKLDYFKRLNLYADAIKGTYNAARNSYMPTNMLVYWRLEAGKSPRTGKKVQHCATCVALNEMSPFIPENLPIVPRSNHTLCLNGCLCKLIYVSSTEAKVRETLTKHGTARQVLAKLKSQGLLR